MISIRRLHYANLRLGNRRNKCLEWGAEASSPGHSVWGTGFGPYTLPNIFALPSYISCMKSMFLNLWWLLHFHTLFQATISTIVTKWEISGGCSAWWGHFRQAVRAALSSYYWRALFIVDIRFASKPCKKYNDLNVSNHTIPPSDAPPILAYSRNQFHTLLLISVLHQLLL